MFHTLNKINLSSLNEHCLNFLSRNNEELTAHKSLENIPSTSGFF